MKVRTELHQAKDTNPEALEPYMPDNRLLAHSIDEEAVTHLSNIIQNAREGWYSHREHENQPHTT